MTRTIAFVDETAHIGGGEINLILIASQLRARGWQVTVVLPAPGALSERLAAHGVAVVYVPGVPSRSLSFHLAGRKLPDPWAWLAGAGRGAAWIKRLRRYFQESGVALVQTVSLWSHLCAGLAARSARIPVVAHFQDLVSASSGFGLSRRMLNAWARYVPDRIVCISDPVAQQFGPTPAIQRKLQIVQNTVDVERFRPLTPSLEVGTDTPLLRVGTVARLMPWKGQHVALEAARQLKEQAVPFHWTFAGGPALGARDYARELYRMRDDLGLADQITFVDWIEDMPELYQSLDLLVHVPVEPEPFGLVLAEAMAAGLPVVTSAGGGAEALVRAAEGVVVPPRDVTATARAIAALWRDGQDRTRRGNAARQFATQAFSVARYMDQWIDIYTTVLNQEAG